MRAGNTIEPDNRLVAGELERRWNEALQAVQRIEGEIAELEAKQPTALGERELLCHVRASAKDHARLTSVRPRSRRRQLYHLMTSQIAGPGSSGSSAAT
jgi:hypothetical protein